MITLRDLQILNAFSDAKVRAAGVLGRQQVLSVGYEDCVKRFAQRNKVYNRFLRRLQNKCVQDANIGV